MCLTKRGSRNAVVCPADFEPAHRTGRERRDHGLGKAQDKGRGPIAAARDKHDLPQGPFMDPEAATVCPPWQNAPQSAATSAPAASEPNRRERPRLSGHLVPAGPSRAARRHPPRIASIPNLSMTAARVAHLPAKRVCDEGASRTDLHTTKHLRASWSGPEGQLASTATGPTDSDHSSNTQGEMN